MKELLLLVLAVAVVAVAVDDKKQRDTVSAQQDQIQDLTAQRDNLAAAAKPAGQYGNPQANRGGLPLWFQERLENAGTQDLTAPQKNH